MRKLPLLLFLLTAVGGAWVAYDQAAAWRKFWMIAGGLALYSGIVRAPDRIRVGGRRGFSPLRLALSVLPTAIALYFLMTNDWAHWMGKLPWLGPVMSWFANWQLLQTSYRLNPNVAGGIIAAFLPLQVAALKTSNLARGWAWIGALLVSISCVGLLMSASRGAWLALTVATGCWVLWKLGRRLAEHYELGPVSRPRPWVLRMQVILWAAALLMISLATVGALAIIPWGDQLLAMVRADRLEIWRNSLDLASDYPFTGVGLDNFEMAYSSYVLLIHVGHTFHAHNLFLDVWLEQGLLGLLAFGWMLAGSAWQSLSASRESRAVALIALGTIVLHGLGDDAFYGYGGNAVPLLFVPLALLARLAETPAVKPARSWSMFCLAPLGGVVVALVLATGLFPGARAALQANLGALIQTRAELSVYHWPAWPIQDTLRRSPEVDIGPAIAHYQAALALDPTNASANRRLGQIELSLGQHQAARRHLEAAFAAAPGQRATRQLLGECYAVDGDIVAAARLWRTVDVSQGQLRLRQFWYEHLGEEGHAARIAETATQAGDQPALE